MQSRTHPQFSEPNVPHSAGDARLRAKHRFQQAGFTLTEIALALGIFSFALVSMLGLLSVGMKNSRKANIQVSASNVMASIAADIQSSLKSKSGTNYSVASPRLGITAVVDASGNVTSVKPAYQVLDEACTVVGGSAGVNALVKTFGVTLTAAAPGTTALRVTISWPPNPLPGVNPEGTLDTLIPLPVP
jgi:uncharacterized protein (TIGR02598 family)